MENEVAISTDKFQVGDCIFDGNHCATYRIVAVKNNCIQLKRIGCNSSFWQWIFHPIVSWRKFGQRNDFTINEYSALEVIRIGLREDEA